MLAAVTVAACVRTGARPVAPVLEEVIRGRPAVTFAAALQAVTDKGLPLRQSDLDAGLIETNYVDLASYDPLGAGDYPVAERQVRFRLVIAPDTASIGSRVAIFVVYTPFRTGISTSERNERAIPRDHPGMAIARELRDRTKRSVEGQ
ncbi:MAG: hypothetical protein OER21_06850 [Gemmatimonadota bacterium]|nr:hypothetical protein [Gemmatimonadota bacterium]